MCYTKVENNYNGRLAMGLSDDIRQADEEKTLLFIENKKREEQVAQAKTSVFSVFKKYLVT